MKRASVLFLLLVFLPASAHLVQGKERDTFSISLVQQALVKKMEGREVICEDYTVEKGDHIWQLLRERGLLKRPDLAQLLDLLKGVNKSLTNLDLIRPGETILIPLNIIPVSAFGPSKGFVKESIMGVSLLKDIDFENYVVRPGDSLTLIAQDRYEVPTGYLYKEYLALVRTFNPALKNPNLIYPNQVIRLPIYSPKMVRVSIKPEKAGIASERTETSGAEGCGKVSSLMEKLRDIFTQMGEEWIDSGEQFIPLKSGAQINVKADSFPSLNFSSGRRLVIDLRNELPADICQLIESDWEDYKIVHLAPTDNLKAVMDKILAVSNYYKILKSGERFEVGGDIDISVAGDWVIIPYRGEPGADDRITAISLIDDPSEKTPSLVRAYLEKLGIKVIDYPDFPARGDGKEGVLIAQKIETKEDMEFPLPTALLKLAGQPSSSHVKIPVYQGESSKFNLIIQADLFFNRNGKDCIIDLTGLAPAILSLLEKHQFLVLSLTGVKDVYRMTELILDFLGLPFNSKPHRILAAARDEARTIAFTIPGISFHDQERRTIFATGTRMAGEIVSFLNQKGYNLLELSQFQNKRQKPATNGQ